MSKTNSLSPTELAWLAGLLEGEGSFFRAKRTKGGSHFVMKVRMTDEDVVRRAAYFMGGNKILRSEGRQAHYQPTYRAQLCGARAEALAKELLPWMGERRASQIRTALEET